MMKTLRRLASILCLMHAMVPAFSESEHEPDYLFRSFGVDEGLSQNTVYSILQTDEGFMWFGTREGLNMYDGSVFKTIPVRDAFPSNYSVNSICQGPDGTIWVGTMGGLCRYDQSMEELVRVHVPGLDEDCGIPSLVKAPSGDIWAPLGSKGILHIGMDGTMSVVSRSGRSGLSYIPEAICFSPDGTGYLIQEGGQVLSSADGFESVSDVLRQQDRLWGPGNRARAVICSATGRLYTVTKTTLYCIKLSDASICTYLIPIPHALALDSEGNLLVGTDEGIRMFDPELRFLKSIRADISVEDGLRDDAIYSLYCDDKGGIWGGTYFCGAFYMTSNNAAVRNYAPSSKDSILGQRVREIHMDGDGTVWIGTEDKGLLHFFPAEDRFEHVDVSDETANIQGILVDDDGIWVGTHSTTVPLIFIDRKTGRRKPYPEAGNDVLSLLKTRGGVVTAATQSGVMYYNPDLDKFVPDQVMNVPAMSLTEDQSGNVWASTNGGLYLKMFGHDDWRHIEHDPSDPESLPSDMVLHVYQDRNSRIWVATRNGGVAQYDPASRRFTRLLDNGVLPYNTVYRIVEDFDGLLWLTTSHGIVHFDPRTNAYTTYSSQDGLLSGQFNYNSLCMDDNGRLYAGTVIGLVSFDPYLITRTAQSSPVVLTSLRSVAARTGRDVIYHSGELADMDNVTLHHRDNTFDIGVAVINYQFPHKNRFLYQMEGYDPTWHIARNGILRFANLRPGHYSFHVKGINADDSFNGQFRDLDITVKPPLLLSWWAFIIYLAIVALASIAAYKYVSYRTRTRLEAAEREMDFQKQKEVYAAKFEFFTNIAHEIKTPLSLISGPAESLRSRIPQDDREAVEDIECVLRNSNRLSVLVGQLLDFRRVEAGGFEFSPAETDVSQLLRGVFSSFEKGRYDRRFSLEVQGPDVICAVDKELMTKLFTNLMSNAVKYSKSYVDVVMSSDANSFTVSVTNDGDVVPLQNRESVFTPFVRYNSGDRQVSGTGIGLPLSRSLAAMHAGTLEMDDDETVNRFVLDIPIVHTEAPAESHEEEIEALPVEAEESEETGRRTILVVDDNQEIRRFVARQLDDTYNIIRARDGLNALEKLQSRQIDLVISDVMMPEMDGMELCDRVKSDLVLSHIPVILLTAKDDIGSKIEGLGHGAEAYIEKPFSMDLLRATIKGIFDNRSRVRHHFAESVTGENTVPITFGMSKVDKELVERIDRYIAANLGNPDLSVEDLAAEVCMSSSNLFRKMKGLLDMTPNEYIQGQRLRKAAEMLSLDSCTVADVSEATGFSTHSYFSSCFKKHFGKTPKEYQRDCHSTPPVGFFKKSENF